MDLISIASTVLAFFIVVSAPGPATILVATIAMRFGRKAGLIYGLGLSCGLGLWGIIAATGMGAAFQSSFRLLMTLKIVGGLYLLWLAFLSARTASQTEIKTKNVVGKRGWFLQGLLLNMSNPKAIIAWIAAFSVGLDPSDGFDALAAATVFCIAVGFSVYALYAIVFSIGRVMRGYQHCHRWINGAVAGVFTIVGFGLIRSAFDR